MLSNTRLACAALWDIFLLLFEDLDNKLETCLKLFILILLWQQLLNKNFGKIDLIELWTNTF